MSLYPNHKIRGARSDWEITSMDRRSTGRALRNRGVPEDWGDPIEAVAWFAFDGAEAKAVVADYSNGRRVEFRQRKRDRQITFLTIPGDPA